MAAAKLRYSFFGKPGTILDLHENCPTKEPFCQNTLVDWWGSSDPSAFSSMASHPNSRKSFIDSSISIARSYGFHGLDLDWEYPSDATQMTNLGFLLNEWRAAVNSESTATGKPKLFLTAAVFRNSDYYTLNYPIQAVKNGLDWINVMAYDFYGPGWSNVTGPPAALYNPGTQISGDYGITSWIQSGIPANKIVLGFPFYGYAWRLVDANNHGFFAPTSGAALTPDGSIGYGQILSFISSNKATEVYNGTVVSNYCYCGTTWIGYDDVQSITAKVSYAQGKALLGYFAWHVGADSGWTLSQAGDKEDFWKRIFGLKAGLSPSFPMQTTMNSFCMV
ncbi:hypothetical protein CCACVL1_23250 [Corchorus capsularis]|uniref:GH18 domain-containing protein n=1 Tax=Corchorus capsularis TaxID=210143 RepID=A0A1R3GUN3_COCAP|nr:hypothetical protein CCACVL1_23250 [Corchorus capsularis]